LRALGAQAILGLVRAKLRAVPCTRGPQDGPFPERHGGWAIALVRRGTFTYRATSARHPHVLREGWLLVCRKDEEYECGHPCAGGDDCAVIELPELLLDDVLRHVPAPRGGPFPTCALPTIPRVALAIEQAMRARAAGAAVDVDALALDAVEAVVHVCSGARAPARSPSATDRDRVQAAVALLDARSHEPWALSDLAEALGASAFQLARSFRAIVGTTPHRYLVSARLRRAARLLLDTHRPVTDLAYDVGFGDLSNFIRTFRRELGCSPTQYRRVHRCA
jgi:AraC-like DNA-binding protein